MVLSSYRSNSSMFQWKLDPMLSSFKNEIQIQFIQVSSQFRLENWHLTPQNLVGDSRQIALVALLLYLFMVPKSVGWRELGLISRGSICSVSNSSDESVLDMPQWLKEEIAKLRKTLFCMLRFQKAGVLRSNQQKQTAKPSRNQQVRILKKSGVVIPMEKLILILLKP